MQYFVDNCLSFWFSPLCCLSSDLRILITPLASSSSSHFRFVVTAFVHFCLDYIYACSNECLFCNRKDRHCIRKFLRNLSIQRSSQEEFEDTKGAIRIRKSTNRLHNGQKKKDKRPNNDPQNIHIKLKFE